MPLRALLLSCLALAGSTVFAADKPAEPPGEFRVVGYLPDYRATKYDLSRARSLTDLIVFSAEPTKDGSLNLDRLKAAPWPRLRAFKTRHRVRLILCVGGWERSEHFPAVASSEERRKSFVKAAVRVCLDHRLDGLDLDWEHPKTEKEQDGYGALLTELRGAFKPHGLMLSVTMAAWQKLPQGAFDAVDAVHLMAYDHEGKHSTFDAAWVDVKSARCQGVPAGKIVLGLPFYGRHTKKRDALTYAEVVEKFMPELDTDEAGSIYFNGPKTIRRKTEFALKNKLGGVMAWELGQDADGKHSLLGVIDETIRSWRKR